ncbi:ankyrin repeat domain-containing protein [Polaribacter vadi]|uniref:ankyrin repeat domain-containing protein n=1 Tax=Polaribacter TaxID=52959 RepID=UPI001C09004C|nr:MULTISPECIES: ankyrin repeat domain-containing protein [Polaribacter]MBU3010692.1 ankyrin repeat domain-containing protein [Polaribacter vadi]MDO6740503.1 ankyrin repeat domain-containing protein [Polaribacter sp. 1_MG-2023]
MKLLTITSMRITIQIVFFILLLTSSCVQSNKKTETNKSEETTKTATKPNMDIHAAVLTGNLEAVKQNIEAGTDINQKEAMSGSTPLMSAATFNKTEIAKVLINADADLTIKNNDGGTALHTAAFFGRIEIVQLLIDAKANKTVRNSFGATPREIVMTDFTQMKPIYEMLIQQLKPMGFTLDLDELQKARPVVAMMLQ